jgi:hypothetical protein
MRTLTICLVVVAVLSGRTTEACSYVHTPMFAGWDQAAIVALVVGQEPGPGHGPVDVQVLAVLKEPLATVPRVLQLHEHAFCDVAFPPGQAVLVFLDGKHQVLGLGSGALQLPTPMLLVALWRWQLTSTPEARKVLLGQLTGSLDERVARDAQWMVER